jgi:hypothetical protein
MLGIPTYVGALHSIGSYLGLHVSMSEVSAYSLRYHNYSHCLMDGYWQPIVQGEIVHIRTCLYCPIQTAAAGLVHHRIYLLLLFTFGPASIVQFGLRLLALSTIGLVFRRTIFSCLPS